MSTEEQVLLALIRASLFGIPPQIPAETDWEAVMREAGAQTVLGIVAQAVPAEEYPHWKAAERRVVANSAQKVYAEQELLQLFAAAEIPLAILKGNAAAQYYPTPSRRWMGDVDFIVPPARFAEAKALMLASGYVLRDGEQASEERDMPFFRNGIEFELHHRFSDPDCDIERYILAGLEHIEMGSVDGHRFPFIELKRYLS